MKKNTINNITRLSAKMPKTLNEALNFNADQTFEAEENTLPETEPQSPEMKDDMETTDMITGVNPASEKAKKLIDDIRKMSLRAMAELADTPEDANYVNLKAIWRLCDKAVTEKQEEQEILQKNNRGN